MNVAIDPWIPVVRMDETPARVSLRDVFGNAHEIRDLAARPHERIAVMRLLICIAQAALDGPRDRDQWTTCRPQVAPAAADYLGQWLHAFELFGKDQRFLQIAGLDRAANKRDSDSEDEGNSATKLDLALATGNTATVFDNGGGSERAFTPAELAQMLLTFQCFSPGGRIGVARWCGRETPGKGSSKHSPCIAGNMLHAFVRGDSLLETLHRNLLPKDQIKQFYGDNRWGKPVWEHMPQSLTDTGAINNANATYLGRLVPLARAIRLSDDCSSLILANGLDYSPYADGGLRELTATIVTRRTANGQDQRVVLPGSPEKAVWRELHALTVKAVSQTTNGGTAALQNITDEKAFDLWVGCLAADKAKPIDTIESVFHVPASMLCDSSQRVYEQGVRLAETSAFRIMRAVSIYHKELGDNLDRPEMKNRRRQIQTNAVAQFWADVESAATELLEIAANPAPLGLDTAWDRTDWGRSIGRAMRIAYEGACPHETVRQIRAFALGLKALFRGPAEPPASETEKEVDE